MRASRAAAEIGESVGCTRRRKEERTPATGDDFVTDLHRQFAFQHVKALGMFWDECEVADRCFARRQQIR
jgi:hypothetical protein